jgi:hypothetical protein
MFNMLKAALCAVIILLSVSIGMLAHHTSAGLFSTKVSKSLEGTVQRWLYVNPHAALVVEIKNESGIAETWRAEFTSPGGLKSCCGISRMTFKQGDKVTVYGHPYFNNIKTIDAVKVTDGDGKEYTVRSSAEPEYETGK